jgi:hypothetical protein
LCAWKIAASILHYCGHFPEDTTSKVLAYEKISANVWQHGMPSVIRIHDGSGVAVWRISCQRFGERLRRFGRAEMIPARSLLV